jgi:gas vesicle protein
MRKFGNFIFGAFLGGLIGSTMALLFAPTAGENARREIVDYFTHIKEEVNRAADDKRAELVAQLDDLRSGK